MTLSPLFPVLSKKAPSWDRGKCNRLYTIFRIFDYY